MLLGPDPPPEEVPDQHAGFTTMVEDTFKSIAEIEGDLSDDQRLLLHLPRSMGGLGLTTYTYVGPHAYAASVSTDPNDPDQQTRVKTLNEELVTQLSPEFCRHRTITSRAGANAWLSPRTYASRPLAFALALQHRIRHFGAITLRTRCDGCNCDLDHSNWDGHALGCASRKGYNATHRHNRMRSAIARVLRDSGVDVMEEVSITSDLRMDIVVTQDCGKELWIDLTVFTTDSKTHAKKFVEDLEVKARKIKQAKYSDESEAQNAEFVALPFDVHGGIGAHGARTFRRLAAIARIPSNDIIRAAAFALHIGNGMILMSSRRYKRRVALASSRKQKQVDPSPLSTSVIDAILGPVDAAPELDSDDEYSFLQNTPAPSRPATPFTF